MRTCLGFLQVGVHSAIANKCVAALLDQRLVAQLGAYEDVVAEVDIATHGKRSQAAVAEQVLHSWSHGLLSSLLATLVFASPWRRHVTCSPQRASVIAKDRVSARGVTERRFGEVACCQEAAGRCGGRRIIRRTTRVGSQEAGAQEEQCQDAL